MLTCNDKKQNILPLGYGRAVREMSLIVSWAVFFIALFVFFEARTGIGKNMSTVQGRVYIGQDGLVLETYTGEIFFLRGRNLGQYESMEVKASGLIRQDDSGLMILNVHSCEAVTDDFSGVEDQEEEATSDSPEMGG